MKKISKKVYITIGISMICILSILIGIISFIVINNKNTYYSYNALNTIKSTLKEEFKDDKIYTFNEGDEENEFIMQYQYGYYCIEYKNKVENEEGYPLLTQKFKKAFPSLNNLNGEITFIMGGKKGFESESPHWVIVIMIYEYKDSNAYWNLKSDEIINGKYVITQN